MQLFRKISLAATAIFLAMFAFGISTVAHAATVTWTGGGGNANWSTGSNWSTASAPGSGDVANFDGTCSSNCSPTIDTTINVGGIDIQGPYGGTITQASGSDVTIGGSGFVEGGSASYYSGGKVGSYSGTFDGSDDTFTVPGAPAYGSQFTISTWIKTSSTGWKWLITKSGGSWLGINPSGYLDWTRAAGTDYTSSGYVTDGAWHLVTVTFNSGALNLYLDGNNVGSWSGVTLAVTSGANYFGQRGDGVEYYNGLMDDVRMYSTALSSSSIQSIYTGSPTSTSLVGEWSFEENGSDSSGSGNSGTWSGTPTGSVTISLTGSFISSSNSSDWININGGFVQAGGVFTAPAGTLTTTGNLTLSGGTFNANGGTVAFDHLYTINDTVTCTGSPFHRVSTIDQGDQYLVVSAGCTIDLGANPSTIGAFINYGTIKVDSGTWTNDAWNLHNGIGNSQNYGTIDASGASGWLWNGNGDSPDGLYQMNAAATVLYGGSSMTFTGDLNIATGTFPTGKNITFDHKYTVNQTVTCNGSPFGVVNTTDQGDQYLVVSAGCSIDLGANPSTIGAFINYGTITVDSGTWTNDAWNLYNGIGNSQNFGTINAAGATGWLWNGNNDGPDGLTQENGSAVVTYGGSSMTFTGDLNIASGTFPTGKNIVFQHTGNGVNQTVTCNGSPFGTENATGNPNSSLTVSSGCTIDFGTNPSTVGNYINYGVIKVDSGTWTNNTNNWSGTSGGDSYNYGTINASGATGWLWNGGGGYPDGLIQETGSASVSYAGTAMTFEGDLNIATGTFPTGLNVTFQHATGNPNTVTCNGNPFGTVSITGANTSVMVVSANCTIDLGANPSTVGNFENYGVIKVDSGTWSNNSSLWTGVEGGDSYNYGSIINNGTGWLWNVGSASPDGLIQETGASSVSYAGTSMTFMGDLNVATGTFQSGENITFQHINANGLNLTCNGNPFSTINTTGAADAVLIISAGCTVDLGTNPSTVGNFINYGTMKVDSGTWTNTSYNWSGIEGGNSYNYGSIINNGSGWNWSGSNAVPDGLIQEDGASSVTYAGSLMTLTGDLNISTGTFQSGVGVTFQHEGNDQTLTCAGNTLGTVMTTGAGNNLYLAGSSPCAFSGDFDVYSGGVPNPGSAYTLAVGGNYTQSDGGYTVGGSNLTLSLVGGSTSTINVTAGTFGSALNISKSGIATTRLISDLSVPYTCTINSGTFDINNHNFTCSGALAVNSGGWLADYPTYASTLNLGSTVTNNGVIFLDGSGPVCTTPYPQFMSILSTASGTQRAWSGTGEFVIRSAIVKDQTASPSISAWNGTFINDTGWSAPSGVGRPQLVESTPPAWSGSGASSLALSSFTYWPKPTDLIVVAVSGYGQTITAPTDNASNTYFLATSTSFGSPSNAVSLYYAENINSTSSFVVTLHGTGGGGSQLLSGVAYDFTGMAPSSTFDNASVNADISGNAVALTSGSAVGKSSQDELFFGAATPGNTAATITSGSGWTSLPSIPSSGSQQGLSLEYLSLPTPSTTAATWSSNASTTYGALLGIFDPPGFLAATGFAASGTLDSAIFDTKSVLGAQLNSVVWNGSATNGAAVGLQLAVSSSSAGPWVFEGPSGDGTTYFTGPAGTSIPLVSNIGGAGYAMFNGYEYFRYRILLFADSTHTYTPTVTGVNVNWSP